MDERHKYKKAQDTLKEKQNLIHKDNKRLISLINVNEQNYVTMKDHIGLKEENEEMRKQYDK